MENETGNLVWIDLETGGLCGTTHKEDPRTPKGMDGAQHYAILEIGVHVTDKDLNIIDNGLKLVIYHDKESLKHHVGEWSQDQFRDTLMVECQNTTHPTLESAEEIVISYLKSHGIVEKTSPLCGNSIYLDRRFIETQMPSLNSFLHYRQLDVSSVGEMVSRWYPEKFDARPEKKGSHSALADIRESIEELRYYQEQCFIPVASKATESGSNDDSFVDASRKRWNSEADEYNQWDALGQNEKDELIESEEK